MQTVATISVVAAIFGILFGLFGWYRTTKKDIKDDTKTVAILNHSLGLLQNDLSYIKIGIDDVRLEQRAQGQRFDVLAERVTRVEESAKQAHHRINRVEGGAS